MGLFRKQEPRESYDPEKMTPASRSSICTGERTACMRHRETGKVHEVMLIRTQQDLKAFAEQYGVEPDAIETIY